MENTMDLEREVILNHDDITDSEMCDELVILAKTPCTHCGSNWVIGWRAGTFLRGCCRAAGDTLVAVARRPVSETILGPAGRR